MNQLEFNKTKKLMDKYKIPYSKLDLAVSEDKAVKIAKQIGYPVAIKIISKDIVHKTDIGAVKTNLENKEELISSYKEMTEKIKKKFPKAKIEGVLIQKMEQGTEFIIGMKRDPQFDAVLMFGLGGIFVELLKDISFRISPIDKKQAEEMINEIKSKKILQGIRGSKPLKVSALIDLLVKVSKLSVENKNIQEIDLNPVIADENSAKVVDVRIMTE